MTRLQFILLTRSRDRAQEEKPFVGFILKTYLNQRSSKMCELRRAADSALSASGVP